MDDSIDHLDFDFDIEEPVIQYINPPHIPESESEQLVLEPVKSDPMDELLGQIRLLRVEKELHAKKALDAKADRSELAKEEEALKKLFYEQMDAISLRRANLTKRVVEELNQEQQAKEKIAALQAELDQARAQSDQMKRFAEIEAELRTYTFPRELRPYQVTDIIFTVDAYEMSLGGVLNANEMSLGKTAEAIIALMLVAKRFERKNGYFPSILWATKKSLITPTCREISFWSKMFNPMAITGPTESMRNMSMEFGKELPHFIAVTNYEAIRGTSSLRKTIWNLVVIDEVHKLKGGAAYKPSQIWIDCKDVAAKSDFIIMLSGTPMQNKVSDIWAYLHIFDPERFPTFREFEKAYCTYAQMAGEMQITVDVNKLLDRALRGRMIKRTKAEVGVQLPELTFVTVDLEMEEDQAADYKMMRDNFFVWLEKASTDKPGVGISANVVIAQLIRLRQINTCPRGVKFELEDGTVKALTSSSSKVNELLERLEGLDEQVVVFSNFNEPLFEVQKAVKELGRTCEVIYGGTSSIDYQTPFQQKQIDVLCINMEMGEGLNLHKNPERWPGGASVAFILDYWWNAARLDQAMARIHRPGAVEPCFVYYLRNEKSVDTYMESIVEGKRNAIAGVEDSDILRPPDEWRNFLSDKI